MAEGHAGMADRELFESLALPHLDALYRAALSLCGQRAGAEDLVQAACLKAFERFESFQAGSNCKAWLLRILRNTWIDELRRRKVAGTQLELWEHLAAEPQTRVQAAWTDAEELLEMEAFADPEVIRALGELPADQRLTLLLVDVEQFSHDEAAEVLDVPTGTVKSRASRARAAMRDKLAQYARDRGFTGRRK